MRVLQNCVMETWETKKYFQAEDSSSLQTVEEKTDFIQCLQMFPNFHSSKI